jgi:type II secretory pathway pseudopilin PulG
VIITILAILGTIGFISLQNSSSKSRDSNRIATIRTAVTGLSTKVVETGLYPLPDGQISTGSIQGVEVAYKGEF